MIYLCTKFQIRSSKGSLVIAIKPIYKRSTKAVAMLFYILQANGFKILQCMISELKE
jgi:hypothetical protein